MDWQAVLWTTWMVIFTPTYLVIRLLWWPVTRIFDITLTLLAPVIYTGKVFVAPFFYVYSVLPRVQPLYIFFGSAAFLGLLAGVATMLTSTVLSTVTGMHNEESSRDEQVMVGRAEGGRDSPGTATPTGIKRLDEHYSSQESDWQWLEKTPPGPGRRRKQGLLAQTILEEDDDS